MLCHYRSRPTAAFGGNAFGSVLPLPGAAGCPLSSQAICLCSIYMPAIWHTIWIRCIACLPSTTAFIDANTKVYLTVSPSLGCPSTCTSLPSEYLSVHTHCGSITRSM